MEKEIKKTSLKTSAIWKSAICIVAIFVVLFISINITVYRSMGSTEVDKTVLAAVNTKIIVLLAIGGALILGMIAWNMTKLTIRLNNLKDYFVAFADGDFTQEIWPQNFTGDEIGQIYQEVNKSRIAMNNMMLNIKEVSSAVDKGCNELTNLSDDLTNMTRNINKATAQSADNTTHQADTLGSVNDTIHCFSNDVSSIATQIKEIDKMAVVIQDKTSENSEDMNELISSLDSFNVKFNDLSNAINALKNKFQQVNNMTELINDVATQTNMLALNAAIEASRAGEAGKGFAVVAEEITNLSRESRDSTDKISAVIREAVSEAQELNESVIQLNEELSGQKEIISKTTLSFDTIENLINNITPKISTISDATHNLIEENNKIKENITDITSTSQEIAAHSQEISSNLNMMDKSSREVANFSKDLEQSANEMIEKVNKFKLA